MPAAAPHGLAVACPALASPLSALPGAAELIDNELLDTLPPLESESMATDGYLAMGGEPKRQKADTPPFKAPASPEQHASASKPLRDSLAAYSTDDLQAKRAARLARNRQSAKELRNRKRHYAERVGQENETLKLQSAELQARVSSLTAENKLLRQENNFYRRMLARRPDNMSVSATQTPVTPRRAATHSRKSARGVGILASLLAVIGMTVNQDQLPARAHTPAMIISDTQPPSSRRALDEDDEDNQGGRLALPDQNLVSRAQESGATAVASDIGLVLRNAATPLTPTAEAASEATLQLGTRRFVLSVADSAVRWVAAPLGRTLEAEAQQLDPIATRAPVSGVEQDDYILGGPIRRTAPPPEQQHYAAESTDPEDAAVALAWTEDDTTEFLQQLLATMDIEEKQQVINMLVHEYGPGVFGGLFERAMTTSPCAGGQISVSTSSDPSRTYVSTSTAEGMQCNCKQRSDYQDEKRPARSNVPIATSDVVPSMHYARG